MNKKTNKQKPKTKKQKTCVERDWTMCSKRINHSIHGIKWIMVQGHLDYFQKPPPRGRSNTKPGDHGTPNVDIHCFILFNHVRGPTWIKTHQNSSWLRARSHTALHTTLEGPWPHYMILEVVWDGLLDTFFGLSPCHGHGSWLVCVE